MRIDHDQIIAGLPALTIRGLFRTFNNELHIEHAQEKLALTKPQTRKVLNALRDEGFLEESTEQRKKIFRKTIQGFALETASTLKPIPREKAMQLLRDFLDRCVTVKSESKYLVYASKVLLFGSLTGNAPFVNDIDIMLELSAKNPDSEEHAAAVSALAAEAQRNGKRFKNILERVYWDQLVTHTFLRGTSRRISFHSQNDLDAINQTGIDLKSPLAFEQLQTAL